MSQNGETVASFCAAWSNKNVDELMGYFSADAVYINIPIEPANDGVEAIRKAIEGFVGMSEEIEFVTHHSAENPETGVVMNERTDRFKIGGKWIEARVTGIFELDGGKIRAWRDYFDLAQFQSQIGG